ncbi:hypothetical protein, partial [Kitasatospora sp. NPDC093679]|uniref:hypothetical protein n=1 Tax=Kitasatospora sp. NPDC093679 TaxID=3154983 RepID=UPI0034488E62
HMAAIFADTLTAKITTSGSRHAVDQLPNTFSAEVGDRALRGGQVDQPGEGVDHARRVRPGGASGFRAAAPGRRPLIG